jgi:hypothetical protein
MKFKIGKSHTVCPSGLVVNQTGDLFFWPCTVSGIYTFAYKDRFEKNVLPEYGNDENRLMKEFISAPAKRYLAAGYTPEQIRELANKSDGSLPSLSGNPRKTKEIKEKIEAENKETKAIRDERKALIEKTKKKHEPSTLDAALVSTNVIESSAQASVKVEKIYAWSGNPDYFKSVTITVLDVGEVTKDTCLYTNHFLDSECSGCPVYDKCSLSIKFTEETRGRNKRGVATIKKIQSWQDDEILIPAEQAFG